MAKAIGLPPQQLLLQLLDYNEETGELRWKKSGRVIKRSKHRYIQVQIQRRRYYAHRVIFKMMMGRDPAEEIDHINNDRYDNRWCNLREATRKENANNLMAFSNRWGISWSTRDQVWVAQVQHQLVKYFAGTSECPLLARMQYEDKVMELRG